MKPIGSALGFATMLAAVGAVVSGCASDEDVRLLRQPALPPVAIAKASPERRFYHNVAIQEVQGAPEFRWFDGGAVLTTRPTRKQVLRSLTSHLQRADLLAYSRLESEYMLYVAFEDLRGPDVWIGSNKLASARIRFTLVDWRHPDAPPVFTKTIDASYQARWAGITPEIARAAIAGPIGVADDSPFAPIGGVLGGLLVGYYVNDQLIVHLADAPIAALYGAKQAEQIGGPGQADAGFTASLAAALAVGTARGRFTSFESMLAGGLISAAGASQGPAAESRATSAAGEIGAFDGTARRFAATRGLLDLAFDEFMLGLSRDGSVVYKRAVSCRQLNPYGYRTAFIRETADAYAVDCPGSNYDASRAQQVYPR